MKWYQIMNPVLYITPCFLQATNAFVLPSYNTMPGSAISEAYKAWRGSDWTIWWLQGWSYRARWLQHPYLCICCAKGTQWKMGRYLMSYLFKTNPISSSIDFLIQTFTLLKFDSSHFAYICHYASVKLLNAGVFIFVLTCEYVSYRSSIHPQGR